MDEFMVERQRQHAAKQAAWRRIHRASAQIDADCISHSRERIIISQEILARSYAEEARVFGLYLKRRP